MSTPPEPSPPTQTPPPPSSDAILAIPATVSVPVDSSSSVPPSNPPPRKFPAPCWTHDETLALITSYQDKWYSLRRRNLRTADWEAVAEEVTRRCPHQSPAKTSAQCRHKMEKLRKRYRAEKQRINSLPQTHGNSRFFGSSWVFFDLIDSMELGSAGGPQIINNINNNPQFSNVGRIDLDVKPFRMNMNMSMNMNTNTSADANGKGGDLDRVNPNNGIGINNKKVDLGKYYDELMLGMGGCSSNNNSKGKSQNHEFDVRSAAPHLKFKVKNHHPQYGGGGGGDDDLNDDFDFDDEYDVGGGGRSVMSSQGGIKRKLGGYDEVYLARKDPGSGSRGKESVVGEMVASIKMLGEGMVKMEKMKMQMMRDIEKMRMEMEMKRSEMILESQHLIVNAFVEGMKKYKKVKVMEIE